MSHHAIDRFARWAADPVSRRASVASLGGAALLASLVTPSALSAKDTKAKKAKRKCRKRCRRQHAACEVSAQQFCADVPGSGCFELLRGCCTPLAQCDATTAINCFIALI